MRERGRRSEKRRVETGVGVKKQNAFGSMNKPLVVPTIRPSVTVLMTKPTVTVTAKHQFLRHLRHQSSSSDLSTSHHTSMINISFWGA